ncbi:hypothetical protein [Actinomadura chokoriensis]|uniref:hypothetical protein n=1 Tax=Actinomadura chokoriensis TaxID=454156 RepID=UPI0031F8AF03
MVDEQPDQEFQRRLRELYLRAGSPSSALVDATAARLEEFYPLGGGRRSVPRGISRSTLSQVVKGTRLPTAGMLAAIVLSLQRCGWENGSLDDDPGPDALPEWHRLLREAQAARAARPAASRRPAPVPADGPRRRADPVVLEPRERAELRVHGRYAAALERRAAAGDRDAVYEIAVLLGCVPGHGHKAAGYLINAAAAGLSVAANLVPVDGAEVDRALAVAHAHVLAYAAGRRGDREAAQAFLSCAAAADADPAPRL